MKREILLTFTLALMFGLCRENSYATNPDEGQIYMGQNEAAEEVDLTQPTRGFFGPKIGDRMTLKVPAAQGSNKLKSMVVERMIVGEENGRKIVTWVPLIRGAGHPNSNLIEKHPYKSNTYRIKEDSKALIFKNEGETFESIGTTEKNHVALFRQHNTEQLKKGKEIGQKFYNIVDGRTSQKEEPVLSSTQVRSTAHSASELQEIRKKIKAARGPSTDDSNPTNMIPSTLAPNGSALEYVLVHNLLENMIKGNKRTKDTDANKLRESEAERTEIQLNLIKKYRFGLEIKKGYIIPPEESYKVRMDPLYEGPGYMKKYDEYWTRKAD